MHGSGALRFVSPEQGTRVGNYRGGISEELVNRSLVIIALLSVCHLLVWFQAIIVPFMFSLFFMYLMDPLVSLLVKTPRGCWIKFSTRRDSHGRHFLSPLFGRSAAGTGRPLMSDGVKGHAPSGSRTGSLDGSRPICPRSCASFEKCCGSRAANTSMPRWLAVLLSLGIAVGVCALIGDIVASSIRSVELNWHKYEVGMSRFLNATDSVLHYLNLNWDNDVEPQLMGVLESWAGTFVFSTLQFLAQAAVTLVFLIYLSLSPIRPKAGVWGKIDRQVRRYIRLKTFVCVLVGALVGIALACLGIDLAWLYALLTFIANYVPNVGPVFATLIPLPLVLLDPGLTVTTKVLVFVLPLCVHMVVGNIVEPHIFGDSLDLHPIIVLLSLAFWAVLWGVAGMILAVPLIAVMRIILSHLEHPYAAVTVRVLEGRFFGGRAEESFRDVAADSVTSSMDASNVSHSMSLSMHGGGAASAGAHGPSRLGSVQVNPMGHRTADQPFDGDISPDAQQPPGLFVGDSPTLFTPTAGGGAAAQRMVGPGSDRVSVLRGQTTRYGTA